jgi:long-chain fatty acid transport protein
MSTYSRISLPVTSLAFLLAVAMAPQAAASGFQLRDQSGSGQGTSYAGVSAGGSDISSMFFNPAVLTRYEGNQLQFGLTEIVPSSKLSDGTATRSGGAGTISGATSTGNIASSATLPTLYGMWSVNKDLKLGISVNVPFGLTTSYDPSWAGRYQAFKSHLETLDITPTLAYRMDPKWSMGVALVARRAKAELSQGIDMGYQAAAGIQELGLNNPGITPGSADGSVDVQGTSWAYGYKLGLTYDPSTSFHMGLGFQSRINENIKGSATFSTPAATLAAGLNAVGQANPGNPYVGVLANNLGASTANGSASAVLNLPSMISLGMIWDLSPTVSLAAEVSDTKWSCFKELRVKFSDPSTQPDAVTTENWKDAMFYALGATCRPGNNWTYRVGMAIDNTPVPDSTRNPRIPDADRFWVSGGVSYQFTKQFGVDAGYSHLFCKNSTINIQGDSNAPGSQAFFQGNMTGTYKNSIDILAVQARYHF